MITKEELDELQVKADQIAEIIEGSDPLRRHLLWEKIWADYCRYCGCKYDKRCYCICDD